MGFNRNELQDDDDFNFDDGDDFNFDDKPNGDSFKFDDDAPDIDLDNAKDTGFGFENDDMPELNEEGTAPARTNRTFIYIAALMIILFLIGLGAVLYLATKGPGGPTPIDLTRSAIETQNANTQALILQTQTASVQIAFAQTQTASVPPTVTPSETPTREPTVTPTPEPPTMDATQAAANALLTQVADQATQTALAAQITPTVAAPNQDAVALTATALAAILGNNNVSGSDMTSTALAAGQGGGLASPTAEGSIGPVPTRLPQTGFFDDVGTGSNVGLIALLALGLFGVIGVSRVVRASNK